jgi:phage-related protein
MPTISTLTVDVESKTSKFTTGIKVATAGLAALAAGAAYAFGQFEESEKVASQTDAVLKSTGHSANVTAKEISGLATALSNKAGIDDEAIQTGENMILTFKNIANQAGKGNDIFNQTTKAVLDMSVAMGQDMKSSAIQVGKALNDPIAGMSALSRVGVTFTDEQKKQIEQLVKHNNLLGAQKIILGELSSEFGGSAAAQATASGKMSVALGNLAEKIGGLLAPAITALLGGLTQLAQFLQANVGPAVQAIVGWFQGLGDSSTKLGGAIGGIVQWFQKLWDAIGPVVISMGRDLVEAATQIWHVLQSNLGPMFAALWELLKKLWDVFKPLAIVIGVQLYIAFKIITEVLPIVIFLITKLIEWLAKIITGALDVVTFFRDKFVEPIINFFGRIIDKVGDVIGWVKDRFIDAWQFILGPIKAVIDRILGWINDIKDAIEAAVGWLAKLTSGIGPVTENPRGRGAPGGGLHAEGGIFTRPTMGIIGEAGPEAVIPLEKAGMMGSVTVNVYGDVLTEGQLIDKIHKGLLLKQSRNATLGWR